MRFLTSIAVLALFSLQAVTCQTDPCTSLPDPSLVAACETALAALNSTTAPATTGAPTTTACPLGQIPVVGSTLCTLIATTQAATTQGTTTTQTTTQATTQATSNSNSGSTSSQCGECQQQQQSQCPNSGGYNSFGQPPTGGYSCQTSSQCSGSAQCSCNGACYNPSEYCCYEGHLGQAIDTICSCPGYTQGGYYAPTPAYNNQPCYFPSCDCTQIASECPYAQTPAPTQYVYECSCLQEVTTPAPTYWSSSCGCYVDQSGNQVSAVATTGTPSSTTSTNTAASDSTTVQMSVAVAMTAMALAIAA